MGAFFMELTSHLLGEVLTGIRVFCFTYVRSRKSEQAHSNVLDSDTLEGYSADSGCFHIACKRSWKMKYSIRGAHPTYIFINLVLDN